MFVVILVKRKPNALQIVDGLIQGKEFPSRRDEEARNDKPETNCARTPSKFSGGNQVFLAFNCHVLISVAAMRSRSRRRYDWLKSKLPAESRRRRNVPSIARPYRSLDFIVLGWASKFRQVSRLVRIPHL